MTLPAVSLGRHLAESPLHDWGPVDQPLGEPPSRTSGVLLAGGSGSFPESGFWRCTEGRWRCEISRPEFCHFLEGECSYTSDDGTVIDIIGGETAWFPVGWKGECHVTKTVAKVYVIA